MSHCENCTHPGERQVAANNGEEIKIGDIAAYKIGSGATRIVICTDVFGWDYSNNRRVAELYGEHESFSVYMPNTLHDSMDPDASQLHKNFPEWIQRNPTTDAVERATKVVQALREEKADGKIIAVGFCYGAKVAVELLKPRLVDHAVLFHPSFITPEDAPALRQVGRPMLFVCAERDQAFTPELRATYEKELGGDSHVAEFVDSVDTDHGFAVRHTGQQAAKEAARVHPIAIEWMKKHA